jgi:hypothetical protein
LPDNEVQIDEQLLMATVMAEQLKSPKKQSPTLKWFVPRWSAARGLKKLKPVLFGFRPILRIVGTSGVIGAVLCLFTKLAFPLIPLAFFLKTLFVIPAIFAYLGIAILMIFLIPGQVKITTTYILHSTGQSGWRANLSDIESSKLLIYSPIHVVLIIRAKGKVHHIALPSTTDLNLLLSLLKTTVVFDKRTQFKTAHALVNAVRQS